MRHLPTLDDSAGESPMRIGVMLRQVDDPGGIGVFTRSLISELLRIDGYNDYLLAFRNESQLTVINGGPNATKYVVAAPGKLAWDQIAMPMFARRHRLDLLYHPKLTIPFFSPCPTVLGLTGAEQSVVPEIYPWYDRAYFTVANPLYGRAASAIITMSNTAAGEIVQHLGADREKIHVVYPSYKEHCRVVPDAELDRVRKKYTLPERFILFVGGLAPLKNIGNLVKGFAILSADLPHALVLTGFKRWKFQRDLDLIRTLEVRQRITLTGFVPDADLPALYNLADVFALPSLYEGFGLPALEAMACGCPVVTTSTGCSPEVVGDAALLVDPYDPASIAAGIKSVLTSDKLRRKLIEQGFKRVQQFSWTNCARETLAVFEKVCGVAPRRLVSASGLEEPSSSRVTKLDC